MPKKTCWKQKLERTLRKHVKYICIPKDEEHAFRHSAQKTMLVYRNHNLTSIKNVLSTLLPKEHAGLLGLLLSGGTQHIALLFFVDDLVDLSTNVEA